MPIPFEKTHNLFNLQQYEYDLPESLIAQEPLKERDQARLMIINRSKQTITHDIFKNIGKYVPDQSVFVVNDSKVIAARLLGVKPRSGGVVEVFLLKQIDDYCFEALVKPLKKIKDQEPIDVGHGLIVHLEDRDKRIVRFNQPNVLRRLEEVGHIPLPPYIKRDDTKDDRSDYQTVYAKQLGSVASPTAGLHFTQELIKDLKECHHDFLSITLHIGYGTFKPVEAQDIREHHMHTEHYQIEENVWDQLFLAQQKRRKIIGVGTTSTRVLETVAKNKTLQGDTDIFIYPGFKFKMIDHLITNFHLPQSTLLMLVSAFGGYELIKEAYQQAIAEKYRFYSYGDAMLIL